MKFSTGAAILNKDIEKHLSKKILLANTADKLLDKKARNKSVSSPSDPAYLDSHTNVSMVFNPDIRYRAPFAFSPLTNINYRNDLLLFCENNEVKKCINILANEIVINDLESKKYPVYPVINLTLVQEDKQEVAKAIQDYLDNVFYPKLYQYLNLKDEGIVDVIKDFLATGKTGYEIVFDSLKSPKEIIGLIPLDPSTLQKIKEGDNVYYVQKAISDNNKERVLHENQVILIEWNKYDFGYVSYADQLRIPFNIMRSMMTSKVLWFAAKSQVRMHIKLALGDIGRVDAVQKLTESKNQYINHFTFEQDGSIYFNNKPNNSGYREFFTAETAASGSPEIEEVNSTGPDLSETDSLNYWEKFFYKNTEIPYDRIDPNATDSWGFTDVAQLRKIEINFGKFVNGIRKMLNQIFLKPIILQLTLKEVEIGVDLSLLDSIKMHWNAFNEYQKLAELEVVGKKVELATNIAAFGELEDVNGTPRKAIPISWIMKNYMDFTPQQLESMETERKLENVRLGFPPETTEKVDETTTEETKETQTEESSNDSADSIMNFEDNQF